MSNSPVRHAWVLALALALAFLGYDTSQRVRVLDSISASRPDGSVQPPTDEDSPTGYAFDQRDTILRASSIAAYRWMLGAEKRQNSNSGSPDESTATTAPPGLLTQWISLVATGDRLFSGASAAASLERAALVAMPALLALFLLLTTPLVAWRWGAFAASVLALATVGSAPLQVKLAAGLPNSAGPAAMLCLLTLLLILIGGGGLVRRPTTELAAAIETDHFVTEWVLRKPHARWWFIASAVTGAVGLSVGALFAAATIGAICVGTLLSLAWFGRDKEGPEPWKPDPILWRTWGIVGAVTSLVLYVAQNFPDIWKSQLDANHPLYAISWLGAGELLYRCGRWLRGRRPARKPIDFFWWALSIAAFLSLPVAFTFETNARASATRFLQWALGLAPPDAIDELANFTSGSFVPSLALAWAGVVVALLAVGVLLLVRVHRAWKCLLVLAATPIVVGGFIMLFRPQFLSLEAALALAPISAAAFVASRRTGFAWSPGKAIFAACLLAALLLPYPVRMLTERPSDPLESSEIGYQIAIRDAAHQLRKRLGAEKGTVIGPPNAMAQISFFGGFAGDGIFIDGEPVALVRAAKILASESDHDAYDSVRQQHITHIFDVTEHSMLDFAAHTSASRPESFLDRLRAGETPTWLRQIHEQSAAGFDYRIYEVVPDRGRPEAIVRSAQKKMDTGSVDEVEPMLTEALAERPDFLPTRIALALFYNNRGNQQALSETVDEIRESLPKDPRLSLGDRVDLVTVLVATGHEYEGRSQLGAAMETVDEKAVRELSEDQLSRFLHFAGQWNLETRGAFSLESAEGLLSTGERSAHLTSRARAQMTAGNLDLALQSLEEALRSKPDYAPALGSIAWILATAPDEKLRDPIRAKRFAARALEQQPNDPVLLDVLACAHAANRDFEQAIVTEKKAIEKSQGDTSQFRERLELFQAGKPFVSSASAAE